MHSFYTMCIHTLKMLCRLWEVKLLLSMTISREVREDRVPSRRSVDSSTVCRTHTYIHEIHVHERSLYRCHFHKVVRHVHKKTTCAQRGLI